MTGALLVYLFGPGGGVCECCAAADLLGYKDFAAAGLTRRRFEQLLVAGEYEQIAPGQFMRTDASDDTSAAWMAITIKRPQETL